jgi:hypothetical protein
MPLAASRCALVAAAMLCACGVPTTAGKAAGVEDAGRYWVSVNREKGSEFSILIGLVAKEPLKIRVARVPNFVDAAALPRQKDVLPLFNADFPIPVKFAQEGQGRLFIEIRSTGQTVRKSYLVFDLFNNSGGGDAGKALEGYHTRWQKASKAPSLLFGDKKVSCGSSLLANARQTGVISSGKRISGVVFLGLTGDLEKDPEGIDPAEWGLNYDAAEGSGLVGALAAMGGEERRAEQTSQSETSESQGRQETKQGETRSETRSGEKRETDAKPKEEAKPASGPFSGATRSGSIASFASLTQGRFGETAMEVTPEFARLKKLDKAELVMKIKHSERSWASGRVFISTARSIQAKQDNGSCWYGDQRGGQEEFLGDIQADYDGEDIRFDITSWIKSNPAGTYFVILENLARGGQLEVSSARIEFKGVL